MAEAQARQLADGPLQDRLARVEDRLAQIIESDGEATAAIMAYLGDARGKRLRPLLVMLWADVYREAASPPPDILVDLGAAVELVHLASLVHDDLIDGAAARRGRPTLARRYGPGPTVLAGDYLFAAAFEMLVGQGQFIALGALARALREMSEAEIEQLALAFRLDTDAAAYWRCVRGKTGSLFGAACEIGAQAGGATAGGARLARAFGMRLGCAFQVADDLLDVIGDPAQLGKPVGQDLARGLLTLPLIDVLNQDPSAGSLRSALAARRIDEATLAGFRRAVKDSGAEGRTRGSIAELLAGARGCLESLPPAHRADAVAHLGPVVDFVAAHGH